MYSEGETDVYYLKKRGAREIQTSVLIGSERYG